MIKKSLLGITLLNLFVVTTNLPLDDHFFRASWFPVEPRFERDALKTIAVPVRFGSTHSSYNTHGHKVELFDLYGIHNLAQASKGSTLDASNPTDKLFLDLTQEATVSNDPNFGKVSISGKEQLTECLFSVEQNFYHGLFLSIYLPVRFLKIHAIETRDLTRPDAVTPTLTTIKNSLPRILADRYGIFMCPSKNTTIGCDGYIMGGWTHNNDATETFDFMDTTLQAGILVPDSKTACRVYYPFDLYPTSNGHVGFPVRAALSGGLFEWLTIGGSLDTTFFAPKNAYLRLKTTPEQSGLIYLTSGRAKVHQGPVLNASTYLKVDHIADVFSLLLGYSYACKYDDTIYAYNKDLSCSIINSDPRFKGWNMHTIHFTGEYDFSKEDKRFGPRVGLFYDKIIAGESITKCSMVGGLFGLEVALDIP